ncbi:MAG: hypothetical protein Q8O57_13920, partial [Kiritimatiellota bacterium]|nr:hypothetical protein [Kiritimatiellota bacterium]
MKSQPLSKFALFNRVGVFAALTLMFGWGTAMGVEVARVTPATTNLVRGTGELTSLFVITNAIPPSTNFTHYKLITVTGGTLYTNDATAVSAGAYITSVVANIGVKFRLTPATNSGSGGGVFTIQAYT